MTLCCQVSQKALLAVLWIKKVWNVMQYNWFFYISLPFLSYTGTESSLYELSQLFEAMLRQFNIPLDVESNNNVF